MNEASLTDEDPAVTARRNKITPWLAASDVLFLSIPKAGRTWVRWFLQTYLTKAFGNEFSLKSRTIPPTDATPEICFTAGWFDLFEGREGTPFVEYEDLLLEKPLILLIRDPRDIVISYYYFIKRLNPDRFMECVPSGTLDDFIASPIYGIERISTVHQLYLDLFDRHSGRKILLEYAKLRREPQAEFTKLLQFLGDQPIDRTALEGALEASSFEQMQAFEVEVSRTGRTREFQRIGIDNWNGDINDLKVRKGAVGGFRETRPDLADRHTLQTQYPQTYKALSLSGYDID